MHNFYFLNKKVIIYLLFFSSITLTGIDDINANNFIQKLDSGVIVCKLAKHIEERCLLNPELDGHFIHNRQSYLTSQFSLSLSKVDENPNDYKRVSI